ncbi:hypothetical protein L228DRAFT_235307 [Xylona heveae TC161]|uniref:BZIP domain-containing protein n=1 Tax=Xylona heveae (strain CBS 132557 / TC161) TaxID=1328760 RepID=A0A165JGH0_XYLHT|nr:hypothetical protein L228DRAFT_235307 [Xylona heveae TC161]KZF26205.1 hypothetical protein L228DRAFT_235307 [Xylona heveae TC161]
MSGKAATPNTLEKPLGSRNLEVSSKTPLFRPGSLAAQDEEDRRTGRGSVSQRSAELPSTGLVQAPPDIVVPRTRSALDKPPRSIGVHSMLNPTQPETSAPRNNLRRSAAHLETEPPPALKPRLSTNSGPEAESTMLSDVRQSRVDRARGGAEQGPFAPTSPARRTVSLRPTPLSEASIDAKQSPFLSPRAASHSNTHRTTSVPELTRPVSPPGRLKQSLSFPAAPALRSPRGGRSGEVFPIAPSRSASPPALYPSFGQAPPHTSPSLHSAPSTFAQYNIATGGIGSGGPIPASHPSPASDGRYGPIMMPSAQSGYQLMTLETDQGPIQVPVDVQAASRVADEKRRRNAGASARFRQRRKEKEREASHTISKLEQQVRDLAEDADFYRQERDHFRKIAYDAGGKGQMVPRPPSPRQRRMLQSSGPLTPGMLWQADQLQGDSDRRARRSASLQSLSYAGSPPIPSLVAANLAVTVPPPSIPPPHPAPPPQIATYGRAVLPPEPSDAHSVAGRGPVVTMSAPPSSNTFETYAPKPFDRAWQAGPSSR